MKSLAFISFLLFTSLAQATPELPELKSAAVSKFIEEANNPKTKLAKRIDQINSENSDGRNPDGTIEIPVVAGNLQVSFLSAEQLFNPWHYASKSEDEKTCLAGGDTATLLILLSGQMGVHGASDFETYAFTTNVQESRSAVRKDGEKIEFCEDVAYDEKDEYKVSNPEYSLSEFKEIEIKLPETLK